MTQPRDEPAITIITPAPAAERPIFEGKTSMTINGRILNHILRIKAARDWSGRSPQGPDG